MDNNQRSKLSSIVSEFQSSLIQSEAEVRSKLIVPLIECLGYPSSCRAEEFPVYGYEGRKKIPAKNVDFLLFSDSHFAENRKRNDKQIQWVHNHSLLVVEAKKPTEPVDDVGQPMYYSIWTKAIAYLQTNGLRMRGFYRKTLTSDIVIIDCLISELANTNEIACFSYDNISRIKQESLEKNQEFLRSIDNGTIISRDEDLHIPDHVINYMRMMLGRNSEGLTNVQIISRFLNSIDFYLQNRLRYDIPEFMFSVPREKTEAQLYINNTVFPLFNGAATYFCWNDYEKYHFENDIFIIEVFLFCSTIRAFQMGFHILNKRVDYRIDSFNTLRKCLYANSIRIQVNNKGKTNLFIGDVQNTKWIGREETLGSFEYWDDELRKMKAIEGRYGIEFNLKQIGPGKEVRDQYESVNIVYDGMVGNNNAHLSVPKDVVDEDNLFLEEAIVFAEKEQIHLPNKTIQGITFVPSRAYFKAGKIQITTSTEEPILNIDFCCEYEIMT